MFWFYFWVITMILSLIVISHVVGWANRQYDDFRAQQLQTIAWRRSSMLWQERALIAELDAQVFVQPLEGEIHVSDDER